jgi:hypothetical protein
VYSKPMLMACYEAPVMLDVAEFVAVAGSCATGGGGCAPVYPSDPFGPGFSN